MTSYKKILKDLATLAVIILGLDAIFLGSMRNYFNTQVRMVQGSEMKMDYLAAGLCYVVIIGAAYKFLVLRPETTLWEAALLGWSVYLIYELTNKAILRNWSWTTVFIDGTWGGVLFAATLYIFRRLVNANAN
jgi:uncharacterized membrane protein